MSSKGKRCCMCHRILKETPNIDGEPYWVKSDKFNKEAPIICNLCVEELICVVDENEENLTKENNQQDTKDEKIDVPFSTWKISEILEYAKESIKGQDESLKQIITLLKHNLNVDNGITKQNAIVIGKTGVGKTLIAKTLAEAFDVPYVIEDATCFTQQGYVGRSTSDMVYDLYLASGKNKAKAERGIIFIDEIDKKNETSKESPAEARVIESLLTMVQGSKVIVTDKINNYDSYEFPIDTTNITFVVMGAFEELYTIREKRLSKNCIGFASDDKKEEEDKKFIPEDFSNAGFNKQFVGRFQNIIELNELTFEILEDIVLNSKVSGIMPWKENLLKQNITLEFSYELVRNIAKEALKLSIGARAISVIISRFMLEVEAKASELDKGEYICYLEDDIFEDSSKFRFENK